MTNINTFLYKCSYNIRQSVKAFYVIFYAYDLYDDVLYDDVYVYDVNV